MYKELSIKPPIFEMGLKGYLFGEQAVSFAKLADKISSKYGISIIFDPQFVDIPNVSKETNKLFVFSQHMDYIQRGRGIGRILPEALKEAGVVGTILNHAEYKLKINDIHKTVKRADEVGIITLVCADSPSEAAAIAEFNPNIILAEPPELIGTKSDVGQLLSDFISETTFRVKKINPEIIIGCGAGIKDTEGIRRITEMGIDLTGSTSAILNSDCPEKTLEDMIKEFKKTWIKTKEENK